MNNEITLPIFGEYRSIDLSKTNNIFKFPFCWKFLITEDNISAVLYFSVNGKCLDDNLINTTKSYSIKNIIGNSWFFEREICSIYNEVIENLSNHLNLDEIKLKIEKVNDNNNDFY
jgi:hypothetical protein